MTKRVKMCAMKYVKSIKKDLKRVSTNFKHYSRWRFTTIPFKASSHQKWLISSNDILRSSVNRDFRTYASDEGKNCQHISLVRVKKRRYLLHCCSDMFWKGYRCELDLYRIRWRVSWNYIGSPFQVVFNNRHVFDV